MVEAAPEPCWLLEAKTPTGPELWPPPAPQRTAYAACLRRFLSKGPARARLRDSIRTRAPGSSAAGDVAQRDACRRPAVGPALCCSPVPPPCLVTRAFPSTTIGESSSGLACLSSLSSIGAALTSRGDELTSIRAALTSIGSFGCSKRADLDSASRSKSPVGGGSIGTRGPT